MATKKKKKTAGKKKTGAKRSGKASRKPARKAKPDSSDDVVYSDIRRQLRSRLLSRLS